MIRLTISRWYWCIRGLWPFPPKLPKPDHLEIPLKRFNAEASTVVTDEFLVELQRRTNEYAKQAFDAGSKPHHD